MIKLQKVAKRYRREWILKGLNLDLLQNQAYAVTGPNGSGKSTFLKIISGHLTPSKGSITYQFNGQTIPINDVYKHLSFAAPYIELIEELSLKESLDFHCRFKSLQAEITIPDLIELTGLQRHKNLPLAQFSSGMKQRVKLALACCSATPILLLDEPTTNLDDAGVAWYLKLVEEFRANRLIVVASNVSVDYQFCDSIIDIIDYK